MKNQVLESLVVITILEIGLYSSSDSGSGKGCYYNGKYHTDTWDDGCEYICTCVNVETGHFRCSRRCTVYNDIPPGCVLELPPEEPCCMVPVCNNQTTPPSDSSMAAYDKTALTTKQPQPTGQYNANDTISSITQNVTMSNNNSETSGKITPVNSVSGVDVNHEIQVSDFNSDQVHDVITERNPMIFHDATGNEIGHLMSVEELSPLDMASTNEIFIELPSIDDLLHLEKHVNFSHSNHIENDNRNPITEETSNLFIADQIPPPIHMLPNPLQDLTVIDIAKDVTSTPIDDNTHTIPPSTRVQSSTKAPSNVSLIDPETILPNTLKNIPSATQEILVVVHNSSLQGTPFVGISHSNNADANISVYTSDKSNNDTGARVQNVVGISTDSFGEKSSVGDTSTRNGSIRNNNVRYSDTVFPKQKAGGAKTKMIKMDLNDMIDNRTKLSFVQEYNGSYAYTESSSTNRSVPDKANTPKDGIGTNSTDHIPRSTQNILGKLSKHFDGGTSETVTRPIIHVPRLKIEDIAVKRGRCIFMGMQFGSGQTWFDGCSQFCICLDARAGFFNCTKRCPKYKNIPQGCVMKVQTPGCCPKPDCVKTSDILRNYNALQTNLPLVIQTMMKSNQGARRTPIVSKSSSSTFHTATGSFRLRDVIGSTGSRIGKLVPASIRNGTITKNATAGNKVPLKSSWQTLLGFCQYNGRRYRPGDIWQIGCELVCRCLPGLQGQYACRKRCQQYPVVPYGCSLQRPPGEACCKTTLVCPNTTQSVVPPMNATSRREISRSEAHQSHNKVVLLRVRDDDGKNRSTHPLAKLLNTNVASSSVSANSSSSLAVSIDVENNYSTPSNLAARHGDMTKHFPGMLDTNLAGGHILSSSGRVVMSKQAANQKTGPIKIIATTGCVVGNKVYRRGQSWKIGCKFRCFCSDELKQTMTCTQLCPKWKLPAACKLEQPPEGKCCAVPKCAPGYRINYPDGYMPL